MSSEKITFIVCVTFFLCLVVLGLVWEDHYESPLESCMGHCPYSNVKDVSLISKCKLACINTFGSNCNVLKDKVVPVINHIGWEEGK